jgi:uncharacterized protein YlxW (UPF0749 family)
VKTPAVARRNWVLPVTVVCLVLGALLGLEFRTQETIRVPSRRAEVLAQMLVAERDQAKLQADEIAKLRAELQALQQAATEQDKILTALNQQLEAGRLAMGLTDVQGPGIVMTLEDSTLRTEAGPNAEPFLVHDYDLWPVLNELRSAGAEAISVNGQRVIGSTAIRCAGAILQVNGVPVTSPFEIRAIGDPKTLAGALTIPNGVIDRFRASQFPARVERKDEVVIKAIGIAPRVLYSKSVVKPED